MIKKLFAQNTENTYIQFFRYFFVGGFAFLVDFGLLYVLTDKQNLPIKYNVENNPWKVYKLQ